MYHFVSTAEYIRCNQSDNQNSYYYQFLFHNRHKRKCDRNVKRVASRTRIIVESLMKDSMQKHC